MDLLALRNSLKSMVGNPAGISDTQLTRHINDAYRDVATKYSQLQTRKLDTSVVTVAGQELYALPADVGAVLRVRDVTNDRRLEKRGDRFHAEWNRTTPTAKPQYYVRIRSNLHLFPVPDGVYTIGLHYRETVANLVADVDVPILDENWHPGIRLLARWYFYDEQGNIAKAAYAMKSYRVWLSDMRLESTEETNDAEWGVEVPEFKTRSRRATVPFDRAD